MFDDLLIELTRNILEHGGKKLIVQDEFCERVSTKGNHNWTAGYGMFLDFEDGEWPD